MQPIGITIIEYGIGLKTKYDFGENDFVKVINKILQISTIFS